MSIDPITQSIIDSLDEVERKIRQDGWDRIYRKAEKIASKIRYNLQGESRKNIEYMEYVNSIGGIKTQWGADVKPLKDKTMSGTPMNKIAREIEYGNSKRGPHPIWAKFANSIKAKVKKLGKAMFAGEMVDLERKMKGEA
jgi:hypothetical protein